jgi:hypothetical protein
MGSNPINLIFRFLLELGALAIFGYWGWNLNEGWLRYLTTIIPPLLAAILWATFAVIDDPSRSGKAPVPISGLFRLIVELVFFGSGVFVLYLTGNEIFAWIFGAAILLHYLLSYDRIIWLLKQKIKRN